MNSQNPEKCAYGHNSKLSNLYGEITVDEHTFPSIEHAYQAWKVEDMTEFFKGGKFSDWEWVLERVNEARAKPITGNNYKKKNMIGMLARWVFARPLMFGLKIIPRDEPTEDFWFKLFEAKFKGDLLSLLLKTQGELVLQEKSKWGLAENIMGKMLTKFRDSKRPKRDVEVGPTMSLAQVVNKKFKQAEAQGLVIEIDDDDFVPQDFGNYSEHQQFQYALENNWSMATYCANIKQEDPVEPVPVGPVEPVAAPVAAPVGPMSDYDFQKGIASASGVVLTWSHSVESGNYVNPIGEKGEGFDKEALLKFKQDISQFNWPIDTYTVKGTFKGETIEGTVLHVKNFLSEDQIQGMLNEIYNIPQAQFDTKGWFRGKCLNKSRWNFQITDNDVQGNIPEPDKNLRKSSEISFQHMPTCKTIREFFQPWAKDLKAEGNVYGITKQGQKTPKIVQGIGPHVDGERNTVIATNLLGTRELCLCAYHNTQPIADRTQITIRPGDLYIFDKIAAGTSTRGFHIRHWASGGRGDIQYIRKVERALVKKLKEKNKRGPWETSIQTANLLLGNPQKVLNIL